MNFRITGLSPDSFRSLFDMSETQLSELGVVSDIADDSTPGFPCRISLQDANPGERLLLVNFEHLPVASPYRSTHAIYVGEKSAKAYDRVNEIPDPIAERVLSIRAFDRKGMMIDADIVEGAKAARLIHHLFQHETVDYLHIHFAKRGCYAARVDRA